MIQIGDYVCLRHKVTSAWIHVESNRTKKGKLLVVGKETCFDEDAFTIIPESDKSRVHEVYYTMSQIAYIKEHIATLAKGDKISITKSKLALAGSNSKKANIAKKVIHVFYDLIRSCTISSEQNPFIREGIPITPRQTLLRELNVCHSTRCSLSLSHSRSASRSAKTTLHGSESN